MNWRRDLKRKVQADPVAGLALVVAAVSLIVSARSCAVSQSAFKDDQNQFRQERQLVLKGEFGEAALDCSTIKVKPISDGFQFQRGEVYLPPKIYNEPIEIDADGELGIAGAPCNAIGAYGAARMKPKPNFVMASSGEIPIYIKSSYAAKGEAYDDVALYLLHGTVSVQHGDANPRINFSGLAFVQRLPVDQPASLKSLDDLLSTNGQFWIPPKAP